jgi:NADH-quinone oxidoreductase subunit E
MRRPVRPVGEGLKFVFVRDIWYKIGFTCADFVFAKQADPSNSMGGVMSSELSGILAPFRGEKGALIPILQAVQAKFGYLPEEAVFEVARFLDMPASEIYGVATFYSQFRFTPPGKHTVKVCMGTACYVRGGAQIMEVLETELGIKAGETTPDLQFGLERVACFGCCALAPVIVVDGTVYSKMTPGKAKEIVSSYK